MQRRQMVNGGIDLLYYHYELHQLHNIPCFAMNFKDFQFHSHFFCIDYFLIKAFVNIFGQLEVLSIIFRQLESCFQMANLLYALQWSYFVINSKPRDYEKLLNSFPTNLFQLNFWCEVMIIIRIQDMDVPQNAVFYLNDQEYHHIVGKIPQSNRLSIDQKLDLVCYLYSIKKNDGLIRNLQQTIMSAFAMYPYSHAQADQLKTNAIKQYFKTEIRFLKESTLDKVSQYFKNRIFPQKQLKNIEDIILGTFVVQQVSRNSCNNEEIRKFLIFFKKQNVLQSLIQHIAKHNKIETINMVIELAEGLNKMEQIFKLFQSNPEPFYSHFWTISATHLQPKYKSFTNFMLQYSSVRALVLHDILYSQPVQSRISANLAEQLRNQDENVFTLFRLTPEQTASKCLQYYLKISNFRIPQKRINHTFSDPMSFVAIVRSFWENCFHRQILNYCLWILFDRRLAKVSHLRLKAEQSKNYSKNLFLAIMHFIFNYPIGTFLNYYVTQNNRLQQLLSLQSLPSLLSTSQNLGYLSWVPHYVNNELPKILHLQSGYKLILRVVNEDKKAYSLELNYHSLFNIIQFDIINKRNNKFLILNKKDVLELLKYFCNKQKLPNQIKDYADKLLRAIIMLERDY